METVITMPRCLCCNYCKKGGLACTKVPCQQYEDIEAYGQMNLIWHMALMQDFAERGIAEGAILRIKDQNWLLINIFWQSASLVPISRKKIYRPLCYIACQMKNAKQTYNHSLGQNGFEVIVPAKLRLKDDFVFSNSIWRLQNHDEFLKSVPIWQKMLSAPMLQL